MNEITATEFSQLEAFDAECRGWLFRFFRFKVQVCGVGEETLRVLSLH